MTCWNCRFWTCHTQLDARIPFEHMWGACNSIKMQASIKSNGKRLFRAVETRGDFGCVWRECASDQDSDRNSR